MSQTKPPLPFKKRRNILLLGIILVLAGVWAWAWGRSLCDRRWESMKQGVLVLLREDLARPGDRPPIRGESTPGNAWDDYERAMASVAVMTQKERKVLTDYCYERPKCDRVALAEISSKFSPVLEDLHRGAQRREAKYLYRAPDGSFLKKLPVNPPFQIAELASCKAGLLGEQGSGRDAAGVLLDLAQFSRDFSVATPDTRLGAASMFGRTLEQLGGLLQKGIILSREELLDLERALATLESAAREEVPFEPTDVMDVFISFMESKQFEQDLHRAPCMCLEFKGIYRWESWKYGFSDRMMMTFAFDEAEVLVSESAKVKGLPWSEAKIVRDKVLHRQRSSRNPFVRVWIGQLSEMDLVGRSDRLRLRSLRTAAHYLATGSLLELQDPLSSSIQHQITGTHLKVWSASWSGIDHGGKGTWKSAATVDQDLVFEVDR